MSITINRTDQYAEFNVSAPSNRGYITIDTSSWIDKPWMFYELPALKFEIYTESDGEVIKYKNFVREIRTYNPVYSPIGALNVTVDIRNVPEEFTLRVIPIFDSDSISARNMLIENGIENGEIWGKDQDIPTQSFDLNIEFIECTGEYIPPVSPTHEETITFTEPPYTFDDSDGSPIISLTIKGNGQQNGTPSPQNIVPFDGTGERTGNLFDPNSTRYHMGKGTNNRIGGVVNGAMFYIKATPNTNYTIKIHTTDSTFVRLYLSNAPIVEGVGESYNVISESETMVNPEVTISNTDYAYLWIQTGGTWYTEHGGDSIMLNSGSTAKPYEPYGYKIPLTNASVTTPLYLGQVQTTRKVKKLVLDGTETFTKNSGLATDYLYYASRGALLPSSVSKTPITCSHLQEVATAPAGGNTGISATNNFNVVYVNIGADVMNAQTSGNTVDGLKEYLASEYAAGHPVTIWYVLATEQTGIVNEPLYRIGDYYDTLTTDTPIPTAKGSNALTVDTTVQPSEVSITYTAEG